MRIQILAGNKSVLMANFGANLRREREMRGVPLDEIAAATKISVRCLQALEAEEFSKLPGGIFTRSFIRAYAKYLGLDEETVMAEFQVLAPPMEEADLSRLTPSNVKAPEVKSRVPLLVPLIAVAALAGGYGLYRYSRGVVGPGISGSTSRPASPPSPPAGAQPPPSTAPPASAATTQVPATAEPGTGERSANPNSEDGPGPNPAAGPPAPSGAVNAGADLGLTLQIAATEQVWVAVDADGKNAMQRVLKPNDIQTFKAKKSFDVMTGNAQGIILTLNGETLRPLGRNGEVKKVHLTQKDLKNPGL
ncbi:MAG TPA: RodZ domain-containing protein [Terriglobia bacterium]|nr:RodZ domain-containing protein [Terriglobia bacterium]